MAEPFVGQILLFAGNYAPAGWFFCNGQLVPIAQYQALFAVIGTYYGGNGTTNFALPDLRSRVPIGANVGGNPPGLSPYVLGEQTGTENVTLLTTQIPAHNHLVNATTVAGTTNVPTGALLAEASENRTAVNTYAPGAANAQMNPTMISMTGGSLPHTNIQPVLAINYIIAWSGIFPPHS